MTYYVPYHVVISLYLYLQPLKCWTKAASEALKEPQLTQFRKKEPQSPEARSCVQMYIVYCRISTHEQ